MNIKVIYFNFLLVLIICVAFTNVSHGIELNPTEKQIEEVIKIGEANPGKKIFQTPLLANAKFGRWPEFGGGLIKSKLIDLAVMSAMMRKEERL